MKEQTIWLSYDLGIKGDYPGLYKWLDEHQAKECGNNMAYLKYSFEGDLVEFLKNDLERSVDFGKRDRIYVTFKQNDTKTMAGKFILGNRKASPWEGYAADKSETLDQ